MAGVNESFVGSTGLNIPKEGSKKEQALTNALNTIGENQKELKEVLKDFPSEKEIKQGIEEFGDNYIKLYATSLMKIQQASGEIEKKQLELQKKLGMNLDFNSKEQLKYFSKNYTTFSSILTLEQKKAVEDFKISQDQLEATKKIRDLQMQQNHPRLYKMKKTLLNTYHKYLADGKWFKNLGMFAKNFGQKTTHWFFQLLKLLLLMSIFDPNGTFFNSILDFLIKIVVWVIDAIAKNAPKIIKTMIFLITKVIPEALKKIINALFDAFSTMFKSWADEVREKSPFLAKILDFFSEAFGKGGFLREFFLKLADLFPYIVAFMGAIAIITKLWPIISAIGTVFATLGAAASLVVIGIIAFIAIIYKFRKEIAWFFKSIGTAISNFFSYIGKMWSDVWDTLKDIASSFWEWLKKIPKRIGKFFIDFFKSVGNVLQRVGSTILDIFLWPFKKINEFFEGIKKKGLKGIAFDIWEAIKEAFSNLWGWLKDNVLTPIADFFEEKIWGSGASELKTISKRSGEIGEKLLKSNLSKKYKSTSGAERMETFYKILQSDVDLEKAKKEYGEKLSAKEIESILNLREKYEAKAKKEGTNVSDYLLRKASKEEFVQAIKFIETDPSLSKEKMVR